MRSQRGQTTTEYMGALLIVAAVIGVVALSPIGDYIGYHARVLICQISGGENCEATAGDPGAPDPSRCVVSASDKSVQASVKVFVIKLEGGVTGIYRVAADGTTTVTLKANAGAGLEFSTPGVEAGSDDVAASSPKGEFSVTGKGEFARTWKFDSQADADEFIDNVVKKVKAKADLIPNFLQDDDDYQLPPHDSDTIYGGVSVSGSVSGGGGGAYVAAGGGVEGGLGATYNANGDVTYFFKAKANVNGRAGNSFAGGFGANGDGEIVIGITYDKDGNEKSMKVTGVGTVSGGLDLRGNTEDLSGLLQTVSQVGGAGSAQIGKRIEFESELDLTNPANRRAARAFIDGVDPVTGEPVTLATATGDLFERFDLDAQTNARLYDVEKTELGVDIDGSVVGFSAKYAESDANLTDAWYDAGPGGFRPWFDCSQAVT